MKTKTRKLKGEIISTYTKGGTAVFRLVKRRGGKVIIGRRFHTRFFKEGVRAYFPLSTNLDEAKREADVIAEFVGHMTIDDAIKHFRMHNQETTR